MPGSRRRQPSGRTRSGPARDRGRGRPGWRRRRWIAARTRGPAPPAAAAGSQSEGARGRTRSGVRGTPGSTPPRSLEDASGRSGGPRWGLEAWPSGGAIVAPTPLTLARGASVGSCSSHSHGPRMDRSSPPPDGGDGRRDSTHGRRTERRERTGWLEPGRSRAPADSFDVQLDPPEGPEMPRRLQGKQLRIEPQQPDRSGDAALHGPPERQVDGDEPLAGRRIRRFVLVDTVVREPPVESVRIKPQEVRHQEDVVRARKGFVVVSTHIDGVTAPEDMPRELTESR